MGEQSDIILELGISITPEVEPRDLDKSQEDISEKLCNKVTEPLFWTLMMIFFVQNMNLFNASLMLLKVLMWVFMLNMNHSLLIP